MKGLVLLLGCLMGVLATLKVLMGCRLGFVGVVLVMKALFVTTLMLAVLVFTVFMLAVLVALFGVLLFLLVKFKLRIRRFGGVGLHHRLRRFCWVSVWVAMGKGRHAQTKCR